MNESLERNVHISTPEHVQLQFRTAGLGSRAAAQLIDVLILIALNLLLILTGVAIVYVIDPEVWFGIIEYSLGFALVFFFVLNWGYFIVLEHFMRGQTVGKKMIGLRVIRDNGQAMTLLSNVLRNFFRFVDFMPSFYLLGFFFIFFHPQDKRLGDFVAGTLVVVDTDHQRHKIQNKIRKIIHRYERDLTPMHLEPHAKDRLTKEDWQLLRSFMERLPDLEEGRKQELGTKLKRHFVHQMRLERQKGTEQEPVLFLIALYASIHDDWEI